MKKIKRIRRKLRYYSDGGTVFMLVYLIVVVVVILGSLFFAFGAGMLVDDDIAVRTMEAYGFSNVKVVDRDWLFVRFKGGGVEDVAKFTITATNPAGEKVELYVFAGWPFKYATIRAK